MNRLNVKRRNGRLGRLRLGFFLDVSLAIVEAGEEEEQHCRYNHNSDEAKKVLGAFEIIGDKVDECSEEVAQRDREEIGAHDERLQFLRSLGISEFEVGHGNHDFTRSQDQKREDLPKNMRVLSGIDSHFNQSDD